MSNKVAAIVMVRREPTDLKTTRMFCGKPLFLWSIKQGLCSRFVEEVFLTTSDPEYQEMGRAAGAQIIDRPKILDMMNGVVAWQHANWVVNSYGYRLVAGLMPTNPLRQPWDLDTVIKLQEETQAPSVWSAYKLPDVAIYERTTDPGWRTVLFDLTGRYYWMNGTVGVSDWQKRMQDVAGPLLTLEEIPGFQYGNIEEVSWSVVDGLVIYETEAWQQFDIETDEQFELCEVLMKHYILRHDEDVYEKYARDK